jgi:four helix bundle protein
MSERKKFAKAMEMRTRRFAARVIQLSVMLPNSPEAIIIRRQSTKSGTSIGANYREANRARSRADFKSRIKICESEASETQYWIELINEVGWLEQIQTIPVYKECGELLALFAAIGRSTDRGRPDV